MTTNEKLKRARLLKPYLRNNTFYFKQLKSPCHWTSSDTEIWDAIEDSIRINFCLPSMTQLFKDINAVWKKVRALERERE